MNRYKRLSVSTLIGIAVADPEGGFRGFNPPSEVVLFFCLSVYENSHGPGP